MFVNQRAVNGQYMALSVRIALWWVHRAGDSCHFSRQRARRTDGREVEHPEKTHEAKLSKRDSSRQEYDIDQTWEGSAGA